MRFRLCISSESGCSMISSASLRGIPLLLRLPATSFGMWWQTSWRTSHLNGTMMILANFERVNVGYERFSQYYLEHSFLLSYHEHGLVRVHHRTIADFDHEPHVMHNVLWHEIRNVPVDIRGDVFQARHEAWQESVRGRTWTAACADDWHMWPRAKIEANPTLSWLLFVPKGM